MTASRVCYRDHPKINNVTNISRDIYLLYLLMNDSLLDVISVNYDIKHSLRGVNIVLP